MSDILTAGDLVSVSGAARLLGVPRYRVNYLLDSRKIEPGVTIEGRRFFTREQLREIASLLCPDKSQAE